MASDSNTGVVITITVLVSLGIVTIGVFYLLKANGVFNGLKKKKGKVRRF